MGEAAGELARPPAARRVLAVASRLGRVGLGVVFLAAGLLKAFDPAEFAHQMSGYGLVGPGIAAVAAPLLIAFETTLGAALLVGFSTRATSAVAAGLLVAFIGLEAWGLAKGRTESCGCFGAYVQRTPGQVIAEDLLFLVLAALSFWGTRPRPRDPSSPPLRPSRAAAVSVIAVAALSLAFALASPSLPIDALVTRLSVGRSLSGLGIEGKVPAEGRHLVALLDLADPGTPAVAERLNALAGRAGAPASLVLTPSSEEEKAAFLWSAVPAFEIRTVDRTVLKRLYRRLPRFFVVDGGRVVSILDGAPPGPEDLISLGAS